MSEKYKISFSNYQLCFNSCTCFIRLNFYTYYNFYSKKKPCAFITGIKSIVKKKKKKHNRKVLLVKDKLNTIEVLISKTLIDSYISHEETISVNNVLREYNETEEEIK